MIANGEILQLCERGTHWVAKVAVRVNNVFEMVNVELKAGEVENGRLASGIRERVINRALTQIA
jgi:hypothetical protein